MTQENQNINSHIEEYLDYYCQLSHAPRFAVLLKGQWGSGKTWFINKHIEKLKQQKKKCVYVSLYGMTSFSEIEEEFFKQLHPILSSKGMAVTGKILKGVLKTTINFDFNNDGKTESLRSEIPDINLPEYLTNTDRCILIFDDLERCKIEFINILGYINYFVEHQDLKVIILANEEKLFENDNYKDIKEKLIGKTFAIFPNFDGALNDFINELYNAEIKKFLFENTALIKDLYNQAEYENLRCLKQIILDFERIFSNLIVKVKNKLEILQDILKILVVFSIEIKRSKVIPEDINRLYQEYLTSSNEGMNPFQRMTLITTDNSDRGNYFREIFNTYPTFKTYLHEPYPSISWWEIFFQKGLIDREELNNSLLNSDYFSEENTPDWLKLWKFTDLGDDEFENLLKKVEIEYADRKFVKLIEIKHITGLLLHFSNIGLYSKTKKEILQDSKNYIDYLRTNHDMEFIDNSIPSIENIYGLPKLRGTYRDFYSRDTQEFKEFCDYIDQIIKAKVKDDNLPNAAQDLLATMQTDVWKFRTIICSNASRNQNIEYPTYYDTPIFKYIVAEEFTKQLLLMKPEDQKSAVWALADRYDVYEKLLEELNWLKSVRDLLLEEANRNKCKLSGYRLKSLVEKNLNEVIEKLEAKSSMNQ